MATVIMSPEKFRSDNAMRKVKGNRNKSLDFGSRIILLPKNPNNYKK